MELLMPAIVILAGSPSLSSRTVALTEHLADLLRADGHDVRLVRVRELPAEALLGADTGDPAIAEVVTAITEADALVVASGVYKAAYSGVLKTLLDLLPGNALSGKVILPILIGGAPVHTLALDYALRPVLAALGASHVTLGCFLLDKHIERIPTGIRLTPEAEQPVLAALDSFRAALPQFGTLAR
jgi:FMN reductase